MYEHGYASAGQASTGYASTTIAGAMRRPRRRGGPAMLSVIVVVLLAILIAGDRLAAKIAADRVEAQLVAQLGENGVAAATTSVQVVGFPFLTQVARGRYDLVTIDLTEVEFAQKTLPRLTVRAEGVQADTADLLDGTARVVADHLSGDALLPWSTLATLVDYSRVGLTDVTLAGAAGGLVLVRGTADLVGGFEVPVSATARLTAAGAAVRIEVERVEVDADVPPLLRSALTGLAQRLSVKVDLPALPFGLKLAQVEPGPAGVRLVASAVNVLLAT